MPQSHQPDAQPSHAGDLARHEDFVRRFAETNHRIHAFISTLLPHRADADDVFQKTSVILWRKFGEFDPATDFVAWACRVAHFEVHNFLRVERRRPVIFDDALIRQLAEERLASEPRLSRRGEALQYCLDELPANSRQLVEKCYAKHGEINQVANTLGQSVHTLYKKLSRVRRSLRDCIEQRLAEEGER